MPFAQLCFLPPWVPRAADPPSEKASFSPPKWQIEECFQLVSTASSYLRVGGRVLFKVYRRAEGGTIGLSPVALQPQFLPQKSKTARKSQTVKLSDPPTLPDLLGSTAVTLVYKLQALARAAVVAEGTAAGSQLSLLLVGQQTCSSLRLHEQLRRQRLRQLQQCFVSVAMGEVTATKLLNYSDVEGFGLVGCTGSCLLVQQQQKEMGYGGALLLPIDILIALEIAEFSPHRLALRQQSQRSFRGVSYRREDEAGQQQQPPQILQGRSGVASGYADEPEQRGYRRDPPQLASACGNDTTQEMLCREGAVSQLKRQLMPIGTPHLDSGSKDELGEGGEWCRFAGAALTDS
ncbi:hypothetical protein cyc_05166 [Cyclospora cayetanensis]|uniref:Uncharacterized protein n=1 Tax=Cyclospora cayetanensis TaxID=88456 RepID=A0A1D3DAA7_9EIME|nr:hypothetical protein cyc_05166 [Cyclospora cayetanensis]